MEAGRTYARAGLKDKAEQAYQVVIDQYQKSANYNLARKKLAEIQYAQN
jgi:lipopolysaccharide biosynthesis regulator YciM